MLVTVQPDVAQRRAGRWAEIIFGSGITLGSITAIVLNFVFHHVGKNFGPAVAGVPGEASVRLDQVNDMSQEQFVGTFGRLFQGPAWVVERAYDQRPFADTHGAAGGLPGGAVLGDAASEQEELHRPLPRPRRGPVADGERRGLGPRPVRARA